jgi:hypothetical protein
MHRRQHTSFGPALPPLPQRRAVARAQHRWMQIQRRPQPLASQRWQQLSPQMSQVKFHNTDFKRKQNADGATLAGPGRVHSSENNT